jgi:hypothetical protein
MEKSPSKLWAGVLGASSTLVGLAAVAPCDGRGCLACYRCAGVSAAVLVAALCYGGRRASRLTQPAVNAVHDLADTSSVKTIESQ